MEMSSWAVEYQTYYAQAGTSMVWLSLVGVILWAGWEVIPLIGKDKLRIFAERLYVTALVVIIIIGLAVFAKGAS